MDLIDMQLYHAELAMFPPVFHIVDRCYIHWVILHPEDFSLDYVFFLHCPDQLYLVAASGFLKVSIEEGSMDSTNLRDM